MWGEKTGTFTNADRTVHLSERAVAPPGEARSDHDIFLDYARRMGFTDREGHPLIPWTEPEGAFDHFKTLSAGRPCDYSGLTYAKLREAGGVQWPCNTGAPDGTPRLYTDHVFASDPAYCEEFGHALAPAGRAFLKAAHWTTPSEEPDDDYPLVVSTGRTVYHWHTRTKTGRVSQLQDAAPDVWVEVNAEDAEAAGVGDGDWVLVESRRGSLTAVVRVAGVRCGTVFVPFHYGSWDQAPHEQRARAANELTRTAWDPISHQPYFKHAAVRLSRVEGRRS
jgi:anaerobic selenocysteine-containing dehydrogenase